MAKYYVMFDKGFFQKSRSLCGALAMAQGDEKRVYRHVDGIPNPWFVWAVRDGKVDYSKIYKGIPERRLCKAKPLGVFD